MTLGDFEVFERVTIIVARKSDYLTAFLRSAEARTSFTPEEARALKHAVTQAIVDLPISLFVSDAEAAARRLSSRTQLENLNREAIWNELRAWLPLMNSS